MSTEPFRFPRSISRYPQHRSPHQRRPEIETAGENIETRGVDFRLAAQIFLNPPFLEAVDTRDDYGETRYQALGHVDEDFFCRVHMERKQPPTYFGLEIER